MPTSSRERGQDYCLAAHGDKVFAVPVAGLLKVLAMAQCAQLSNLTQPLIGWVEVDGTRVPVARLDYWTGGLATATAAGGHVVVLDTGAGLIGIAVDRVQGIATILATEIHAPGPDHPPVIAGLWPQRSETVQVLGPDRLATEARLWAEEFAGSTFRSAIQRSPSPQGASRVRGYCFFERRGRHFAVPVLAAREVVAGEPLTPVPQAPEHVLGVVNLRGHLLLLINADSFLGLPGSVVPTDYEALVVESGGVQLGLLVDRVGDVRPIDLTDVRPAPAQAGPIYRGVWSGPRADVFLVDVDQIVAHAVAATTRSFQRTISARSGLEEDPDAVPDTPA